MSSGFNALGIGSLQRSVSNSLDKKFDWKKQQEEHMKKWEEEKKKRADYFKTIAPDYESICKQIGYCIYQYVGLKSFKPDLLLGDYDFLRMKNLNFVAKNYEEYIKTVREQDYYKKQNAAKLKKNKIYTFYAPWSFKDRWKRVISRLNNLGFVDCFSKTVHGTHMTFYRLKEDKISELKKEAFIHFI